MFLLIYIYLLIIAGMGSYAIAEKVTWGDFSTAVGMSTLLYVNLIIIAKYLPVFIEKINKKEKPAPKDIFFLLLSIAVLVFVYTIRIPIYEKINIPLHSGIIYALMISGSLMIVYILIMLIFPFGIMEEIISKFSIDTIFLTALAAIIWINFFIFSKYLYRVVRKTIKTEPITKKEIFYLLVSTITIFFITIFFVIGMAHVA